MSRTLIKNGFVVTIDGSRAVHPGGFVATDDARITGVGPSSKVPDAKGFDEVIDVSGCIVLPGLINGHQHHWYDSDRESGHLPTGDHQSQPVQPSTRDFPLYPKCGR